MKVWELARVLELANPEADVRMKIRYGSIIVDDVLHSSDTEFILGWGDDL